MTETDRWHAALRANLEAAYAGALVWLWDGEPLARWAKRLGWGSVLEGRHALLLHLLAPSAWSASLYMDGSELPTDWPTRRRSLIAARDGLRLALHVNSELAEAAEIRTALAGLLAQSPQQEWRNLAAEIARGTDEPRAFGAEAMTLREETGTPPQFEDSASPASD